MLLKYFNRTSNKCEIYLFIIRLRHYWKNMECDILQPPQTVKLMKDLKRDAFLKHISVPRLWVNAEKSYVVMPLIKKLLLKMAHFKPVRPIQVEEEDKEFREILLHPLPVKEWNNLPVDLLEGNGIGKESFGYTQICLNYENWRADEIFKAVLPVGEEGLTSYSIIGHIVHLNLRDHLVPFKNLIGQVLLDKVAGCHTVVNKIANIENTYRNFQMELICGEADYEVTTKENGITFQFDFSKVYWNPRLSTEHERIVQLLQPGDVLYDVFAGVGPFAVPAARKQCFVLANDLNPDSFKWLQINMKRNKCLAQTKLFNKDGRQFIVEDLKQDLKARWLKKSANGDKTYEIHITMNLPAMAVEFLNSFRGLFKEEHDTQEMDFTLMNLSPIPLVHVYAFGKGLDTKKAVLQQLQEHLEVTVDKILKSIHFVRNVAPNKDMYRLCFYLTKEILTQSVAKESERKRKSEVQCESEDNAVKNTKIV